ncbi:MAG: bifunctional diaminohydroxyphosphoribosylaminopyrimidine deaminase/5-amino-6-(5-phosphoribosylamino)uracil reductase RibD [Polyangia bacterium]
MNKVFSEADRRFMREALALAERGRGHTRPNPVVGAVLVRGGRVLARGYHRRAGLPHAEIDALSHKGVRAQGATLYVTLEPCCHQGRTGPCTEAIERAGVRRVVVGCCDENPLVSGRGVMHLRRAGMRVDVGCLDQECRKQNRAFFVWVRAHRPWVTLKIASTLDGFIASNQLSRGEPAGSAGRAPSREGLGTLPGFPFQSKRDPSARFVTGAAARAHARLLRSRHDAVLVGVGTVLADNPRLTVRLPGASKVGPLRVVLDGHLRTPPSARLIRQLGAPPALIIGAQPRKGAKDARARLARERALRRAGAEVLLLPADRAGRISIPHVLRALAELGVQSLLVEGGSRIHGAFISAARVDSVAFFLAPRLVGAGRPIVEGPGLDWRTPLRLGPLQVHAIGEDILVEADVLGPKLRRRP